MRSLIFILLFLPCGLGRGENGSETIPQIQVTHTWGELLQTRPLAVESDKVIFPDAKQAAPSTPAQVSVWVGIDRDHSASYGAVLLYCVAKGVSFSRTSENGLGPLQVRVQAPGAPKQLAELLQQQSAARGDLHDSTYVLFAQSVPLGDPGKYVIELVQTFKADPKATPKVVAKIDVDVSGKPALPWSPWDESDKDTLQGDDHYIGMTVCNPIGGIALPKAPTEFIPYQEAPVGNTPLPQLIPDQPDPQTQLKMVGNTLVVTTNQGVETDYLDDDFLARWWINGKPYVPGPNMQRMQRTRGEAATMMAGIKEVHFILDFHPERLGAKKGDKIGVQVLYCPEGWERCGDEQEALEALAAMQAKEPSPPPTSFSFPSNRIDFIYSGDLKNLQQK